MPQVCQILNNSITYRVAFPDEENCNPYNKEFEDNSLNAKNEKTENQTTKYRSIEEKDEEFPEEAECHCCFIYLFHCLHECFCCMSINSCGSSYGGSGLSDQSLIFTLGSQEGVQSNEDAKLEEEQYFSDIGSYEASDEESKRKNLSPSFQTNARSKPIPIFMS